MAATVALHREVGPARTTIADVARRAGVQRLTVYNHFPDLTQLLRACQGRFLGENPPPALAAGDSPEGAAARLEQTLTALYRWYRANLEMERNVERDRHLVPELDALLDAGRDRLLSDAAGAYANLLARSPAAEPAVRGLIRVAMKFDTWDGLSAEGLADDEISRLLVRGLTAAL